MIAKSPTARQYIENIINFFVLSSFCSSFIDKSPEIAAAAVPAIYSGIRLGLKFPVVAMSERFSITPASIVGIESMKEYCAANSLSKPHIIPDTIVEMFINFV